jgi:hypothetical protein
MRRHLPWDKPKGLVIRRIEREHDRVLLFGTSADDLYHVIAPPQFSGQVGDTVLYEPDGVNFGWLYTGEQDFDLERLA